MSTAKNPSIAEPTKVDKVNLADIKTNDIFSESPHYKALGPYDAKNNCLTVTHIETGREVNLEGRYVAMMLNSADQYETTMKVGLEDKLWTEKQINDAVSAGDLPTNHAVRVGDIRLKGIRSIFEQIYDDQVFMCGFLPQDKSLSRKDFDALRAKQIEDATAAIDKAQKNKEGVAKVARDMMKLIQENPILPYTPGKLRVLRGYKIEFESRDGRYNCVDLDIDTSKGDSPVRPVNINTLQWIVYKGIKYERE